jgi:hypothetical protein
VSGLGTVVLRSPGYQLDLAAWCRRNGYVLADPAHFGYAKLTEPAAEVVTDEQGRSWLKITTQLGYSHTFDRPGAVVADAIPAPREPR